MNTVEKISQQSRNLPGMYQTKVLDFVEYLENKIRIKTGDEFQMSIDFWHSPSLEELAVSQGIRPITDVNLIAGTWPGEDDEGFEEDILALRKPETIALFSH